MSPLKPFLVRLSEKAPGEIPDAAEPISFLLDGRPREGRAGDTVLTAVLALGEPLRLADHSGSPRAGFCLMGACQDCWMQRDDGRRLRACSTLLEPGMALRTKVTS